MSTLERKQQAAEASEPYEADGQDDPSELERLVDNLEEALADGRRWPFTHRLMVDEERFLDLIDRMRVAIPDELRMARRIVHEQQRILEEAEARVQASLSEQGLLEIAQQERQRIIAQAQSDAARIKEDADEYARQVLLGLEERVGKVLTIIQNGLDHLDVA